jgi:acyl CoA:acetate/3-ketoacid CoA transferase alpha subunit
LAEGKEERVFHGERYILIEAIRAKFALVKAWKADTMGNLVYSATARNYNPLMATAADHVIAEVDEIVDDGQLKPDEITTPHNYVDVVVMNTRYEKRGGVYVAKETSA